jgi:hypothetical protein
MSLDAEAHAPFTFSDMPLDKAVELAKAMEVHSTPSFKEKLTYAGYNDVEVHYIVCEQDGTIPAVAQYAMIEMIKTSSQRDVSVHKLQSGHVPVITQTENTAKMVADICKGPQKA